jgi:hypothetical protein
MSTKLFAVTIQRPSSGSPCCGRAPASQAGVRNRPLLQPAIKMGPGFFDQGPSVRCTSSAYGFVSVINPDLELALGRVRLFRQLVDYFEELF